MRTPDIAYLTSIYFQYEAVRFVAELSRDLGMHNPLLITDEGIVQAGLLSQLNVETSTIFDKTETNPTEDNVIQALEKYRNYSCHGIIAFGGGSAIDLAKGVALLAHHDPPLGQYSISDEGTSRITPRVPPLIAIPTTAGSGSEVGRATLLTLGSGDKLGFLSPYLLPAAAVCDPLLTRTMPAALTAASGMDALSHCIEAFCSSSENPVADSIALDGFARGYRNIETAVYEPLNRSARREMMLCSLEGGLAFQKGLGAVHSLSHPLGSLTERRLHHGTLNAIFLPHVLRHNHDFCSGKMEQLASLIGLSRSTDLPEALESLICRLGLPMNLSSLKLTAADLKPLVIKALSDHCSRTNPRPLDEDALARLYLAAI